MIINFRLAMLNGLTISHAQSQIANRQSPIANGGRS